MPSFLVYGNDFLVSQEVQQIETNHQAQDILEGNKTVFDSSNFNLPDFQQVTQALPFMDTLRLVILEDVIKNNTSLCDSIIQKIDSLPESTLLIIKERTDKINASFTKSSSTTLTIKKLSGPRSGRELHQWIKEHSLKHNISISPAGISALADHVGVNLWNINNELEKLNLYSQGQQITDSDVKELVYSDEDVNLFNTIDAIIEKKRSVAFHNINSLLNNGHDTSAIIRLIGRQLRLIAASKFLSASGASHTQLKQQLGITSNFVVDKVISQSNQLSQTKLLFMFQKLVETDQGIKTGALDQTIALDIFLNQVT